MSDLFELPEFILRCIAEDEVSARSGDAGGDQSGQAWVWDSARVVAECAAKRRLVEQCRELQQFADEYGVNGPDGSDFLESLAMPFADRPGYRRDWMPST